MKRAKIIYGALCVVFALIGLVMLIKPEATAEWLSTVSGILLVTAGLAGVVDFLFSPVRGPVKAVIFTLGVIALIAGIFFICHPRWLLAVMPAALGIFLVAEGLSDARFAFGAGSGGSKRRLVTIIIAVLTIALGAVLITNAVSIGSLIIRICGLAFTIAALIKLAGAVTASLRSKKQEPGYIDYEDAGEKNGNQSAE